MTTRDMFMPTYARHGPPMVKGKGTYLWDAAGKKYLDFASGIAVNALGHAHPSLTGVIKRQGTALLHASNLYNMKPQIDLARLLVKHSFGSRIFFCNSGAEAVEAAIKFARKRAATRSSRKYHVLSFTDGFHGRTYGALSATAQRKLQRGFGPMLPGFHYSPYNNIDRTRVALHKHRYAAIIVEPLQGESGFNRAEGAFLRFLRSYATRHNIALVFDEIQCGFGRTGTLWCHEQYGVAPDIMTLAKPLGGGLPLGAVVCAERFAAAIKPGDHGTTFGGNPLACALGCAVLKTVAAKPFLARVRARGAYLRRELAGAVDDGQVKGIVGIGLMIGVRLRQDPKKVIAACQKAGLLVVKAGNNTVRLMPPLTVSNKEIDRAVTTLTAVLRRSATHCNGKG